ncbi:MULTISPECIES: hypothetical protein [Chryseobacterium]|uniref:DUF4843 domain-containing protein n=1 Tax=Chryseobacterium taihuense TaxID=1141221 RepID=A0A4U8WC24_9FLAO|nr:MULTISPECIES: hypothetical protein [Chryseobacterium]QQV02879.1 hypothetical protein I6I61_00505 [Chryseobacterium sp. FDAARGOS 1104]VFB03842.1 Uncharacterised protein [Chryseobacterium taihuense]
MKKVLNYFLLILFTSTFVLNCQPEEEPYFEGESLLHFDRADQTGADGTYAVTYGVTNAVNSDHTVTLEFVPSKSTAILGTDFTIVDNTSILKGGSSLGSVRINITKAAAVAKKQAVFTIKSSTLKNASFKQEVVVKFACESLLAGTYQYSTVNYFSPDTGVVGTVPVTGTVTFTASATAGEYTVSDASFGGYRALYGGTTIASNVRLRDQCNTLSFQGTNQYGDNHFISNVVVNGNQLTFRWSTSYGEYGTTTLTKANGNWPALN